MICPSCQHPESKVLDTRTSGPGIRRRRQCLACGHRFTTFERIERKALLVVKKDGRREPFDRDKVLAGFRMACRKRTVSADAMEEAADRVEQRVNAGAPSEIRAEDIGRAVLDELLALDPVGYVRFASVYLEVKSPEELAALVRELQFQRGPA